MSKSVKSNGVCTAIVTNTVTKYVRGGIDSVIEFNRSTNSDNARCKVDGRTEARMLELAYGFVLDGQSVCLRKNPK